jgi:hypothetical protein
MKVFLFALGACLFLCIPAKSQSYDSLRVRVLKQQHMQDDLSYLRRVLEETHPGLYRYQSRQAFSHKMDSLRQALDHDITFQEFYLMLASLVSDIRCGHTTVMPAKNWQRLFPDPKFFPYNLVFLEDGVYTTFCLTKDTLIKPGYKLLDINGRPIDSVRQFLFSHLPGDGYIESIKRKMLSDNFKPFYAMLIGQPDTFLLTCQTPQGEIIQAKVPTALSSRANANAAANPVNRELLHIYRPRNRLDQKKPRRLRLYPEKDAALLTIRRSGNREDMQKFMNHSLEQVKKHNIHHLIIDLRNNSGGWDAAGVELFTYLTARPARYYERHHLITESSSFLKFSSIPAKELPHINERLTGEADGTFTVKEAYYSMLGIQQPRPNRFTGKVYFLIDGATGSATAEFTAVAHSNRLGVFIGEESGGNYTGGNGWEFLSITLPHSGIEIGTPLVYYHNAVQTPPQAGRGTIPDYAVPYNISDIIKGTDTQLNFALDLIGR